MSNLDDTYLKYADELRIWLAPESPSLFEGGSIVAKIIDDDADLVWAGKALNQLAGLAKANPQSLLDALNSEGFGGDEQQFAKYKASQLDHVLKHKRGIPISLGMVAMCVSDILGIRNAGVNYPGHFLILLEDELVDPFNLSFIDYESIRKELLDHDITPPESLIPCTHQELIGRMIFNLQMIAMNSDDQIRALELNDYLKIALPESFQVPLSRADIWVNLGDISAARLECEEALKLSPAGEISSLVNQRIKQLSVFSDSDDLN